MKKIHQFWLRGQRLLNNLPVSGQITFSIPFRALWAGGGLLVASVIILSIWTNNSDPFGISQQSQVLTLPSEDITNLAPAMEQVVTTPEDVWQQAIVKKGDSLARIFARLDIKPTQLHNIMKSGKSARKLKRIKPGQEINIRANRKGEVLELLQIISPTRSFSVKRENNTFKTQLVERDPEIRIRHAHGSIDSSLYLAAQKAGIEDALIMDLVSIFGWDIDFALDIRQKDNFTVLYEDIFIEGEKVRTGNIIAAEFSNQGKKYRAVRYTDAKGHTDYYDENGRSMRKAFLRTPVAYSRISSRFGKRRHPVLNRLKLHKGVDYAASRGTPVKATGSGKIIYRGRKGGYGKTIVIRHAGKYSTLYAHMSGYKRGLRNGTRVKQGQTIGFVGSTGLATGPHLHYEFRINGAHRNPLRVRLPHANPIHRKYKQDFIEKSNGFFAQLNAISNSMIALNNE